MLTDTPVRIAVSTYYAVKSRPASARATRDYRGDPSTPQVDPVRLRRVRLVTQHRIRGGARSTTPTLGYLDVVEDVYHHRSVVALASGHHYRQGTTRSVNRVVELCRQPTPGPPDAVTCWFSFRTRRVCVVRPGPCVLPWSRRVRRVLVGTVDRRVHRHDPVNVPDSVGMGQRCGEHLVPGPIADIAAMAFPHRLPRAELIGEVSPGDARAVSVDDAFDSPATVAELRPRPAGVGR